MNDRRVKRVWEFKHSSVSLAPFVYHLRASGKTRFSLKDREPSQEIAPTTPYRAKLQEAEFGWPDVAFRSFGRWGRSLEPRGFEPLSRQCCSMDFQECPPMRLDKGFTAEMENDGKSWKLLDVTSTPRDLLPAGLSI